jgi:hypothetical protein
VRSFRPAGRDRYALAGLPELAEERGALGGDPLELRRSLAIGQLPEAEGIADDDELGGRRPRGDLREEVEIAAREPPVTADVQVADQVVGGRHRTRSRAGFGVRGYNSRCSASKLSEPKPRLGL